MKFLVAFALLAVFLNGVICDYDDDDDDDYCQSDRNCKADECCVKSLNSYVNSKVCRDIGDDDGDQCGGEYYCNRCDTRKGLECVPNKGLYRSRFSMGTGTCRRRGGYY